MSYFFFTLSSYKQQFQSIIGSDYRIAKRFFSRSFSLTPPLSHSLSSYFIHIGSQRFRCRAHTHTYNTYALYTRTRIHTRPCMNGVCAFFPAFLVYSAPSACPSHRWRDELGRYSNYRATPLQQVFAVIDLRRVYRARWPYSRSAKTGFVASGVSVSDIWGCSRFV